MSGSGRWMVRLAVVAAAATAAAAIPAIRTPMLRTVGAALVFADAVDRADVVVITADSNGAGALEAADLIDQGVSTRVAVFEDPPDAVIDAEFLRRGIPYEDGAARAERQLRALGVAHVVRIPRSVAGTEDEGEVLPGWCDERGIRSVVLVTTSDHSKRVRRVMRRAMVGHGTTVAIRPSRFSLFDPDRWWQTRGGIRIAIVEMEKLLLDIARHPLS